MGRQGPPVGDGAGDPARGRPRRFLRAWWRCSRLLWERWRALPGWTRFAAVLVAWPVVGALYVARQRSLGVVAPVLAVAVALAGGTLWVDPLLGPEPAEAESPGIRLAWPGAGVATAAPEEPFAGWRSAFDPSTLAVEIVECVQTRARSVLDERVVRQPRIVVRVTNHGTARTVVLAGAVRLDGYRWNGGWKPTSRHTFELSRGETEVVALLADYRHQSSYRPDGLRACTLDELLLVAPQVWPDHPAERVPRFLREAPAGPEREADPARDFTRTDAR